MMSGSNLSNLCARDFQKSIDGKLTSLYILKNKHNAEVAVTNYGGSIVAIMVPDRNGDFANIIQGHDNIDDCINSPEPVMSTLVGRYANRISKATFTLDGREYILAVNNAPNHIHGGPTGFNARVWDVDHADMQTLQLRYTSAGGEEGYPGNLVMTVTYTWTDDNELFIDYEGTTDKKTVVNMTHHGYFSLSGIACPTPSAMNALCQINADFFIPVDSTYIPTGEILSVKNTPFDFTTPHVIGERIDDTSNEQIRYCSGYGVCYVLNKNQPGEYCFAAKVVEPESGRSMEVYTTEPGLQFYTANKSKDYIGQHGATFPRRSALCLEAQHFPDSPNRPYFPSAILTPGEVYRQKTMYKFGIDKNI